MANEIPIGGLQLNFTDSGRAGVVKDIKALADSLSSIRDASKGKGVAQMAGQISQLSSAINKIKGDSVKNVKTLANSLEKISALSMPSTLSQSISSLGADIDNIDTTAIKNVKEEITGLGETADINVKTVLVDDDNLQDVAQTTNDVATSLHKGKESASAFSSILKKIDPSPSAKLINIAMKLGSAIRNAEANFSKFKDKIKGLASTSIARGLGNIKDGFVKVGNAMFGAHSFAGKLLKSFVRIAFYRSIRFALSSMVKGFKEGATNLYLWSDAFDKTRTFANSMDKIATSILYVKNSLGAMVAPIINAVAPAIDYLADKFVGLLNIVNEFISAFTGASTFTVAKKVATKFQDVADGAKDASKAIKSFTIGIDELNIIEDTGSAGGGFGGDNKVAEDWFEKKEVSNDMKDFADKVKEVAENVRGYIEYMFSPVAWEDLKSSFEELGSYLPTWEEGFEYWKGEADALGEKIGDWDYEAIDGLVYGFDRVKEAHKEVIDQFKKDPIGMALNGILPLVTTLSGISATLLIIKTSVKNIKEWINDPVKQFEKLKDILAKTGEIIVKTFPFLSSVFAGVSAFKNLKRWLTDPMGQLEFLGKRLVQILSYSTGIRATVQAWVDLFDLVKKTVKKIKEFLSDIWRGIGKVALGENEDLWSSIFGEPDLEEAQRRGGNWTDNMLKGATSRLPMMFSTWGNAFIAVQNTVMEKVYSKGKTAGANWVDATRSGATSKQAQLNSTMNSIASKANSEFGSTTNINAFKKSGENIIAGIESGLKSKEGALYTKLKQIAQDSKKGFDKAIDAHSPAKLFIPSGKNIVLGVNKGIEDNEDSTQKVIANWVDSFADIGASVNLDNIAVPNLSALSASVSGAINANSNIATDIATSDLANFFTDTLMPVINQISEDAKRQADKEETVTLDGRKITQGVNRQNRRSGFSFTS